MFSVTDCPRLQCAIQFTALRTDKMIDLVEHVASEISQEVANQEVFWIWRPSFYLLLSFRLQSSSSVNFKTSKYCSKGGSA